MLVPCDQTISTYKTSLRNSVSRKIMKLCDWTGVNRWQTQIYFSSLPYFARARQNRFPPTFSIFFLHSSTNFYYLQIFIDPTVYRGTNHFPSIYLSSKSGFWKQIGRKLSFELSSELFCSGTLLPLKTSLTRDLFERVLINVEEIFFLFRGRKKFLYCDPWKIILSRDD